MFTRYFAKRKKYMFPVLAMLALLLLVGCSNGTSASTNSSTTSAQPVSNNTALTVTVAPNVGGDVAAATLKHVPNGMANFSWDHATKMLTVQVMLSGLAPSSTHPNHIHEGSCANQGKALYPLSNLVADAHGVANATTKISLPNGIPAKGLYLDVHNGPALSPADQFLSIACGDIVNHDTSLRSSQVVQLPLQTAAANNKNAHATGVAHLNLSGHTLKVELTLTGLEPNSQHAAHIHAGSCAKQGAVLYPLATVKADSKGKATVTTMISNVTTIPSTGWYVNVHRSTDLATQTGFDPIVCGDVALSRV